MNEASIDILRRIRHTRLRDAVRGRFDASLDWRATIQRAELPPELTMLVSDVVRRTRLWRSERVAVAQELIAHFQDGIDAGTSSQELAQSFGDPKQTARMIRRAKHRCRPLVWQLFRVGVWVLLLSGILYFLLAVWMSLDRPVVKVNYLDIVNQRARSVAVPDRAWPLYRKAALKMGRNLGKPLVDEAFIAASSAKPGDKNWQSAQSFLQKHASELATIRKAANMPGLGLPARTALAEYEFEDRKLFGYEKELNDKAKKATSSEAPWLFSVLLTDLSVLRELSDLLVTDTLRAAEAGDGEIALANVVAMLGMARHCEEKPVLVSMLVAAAIEAKSFTVVQSVLRDHPALWTDANLRDLAHRVAASRIDWKRGFEGDRAYFYDVIQRLYTDDGNGDGRLASRVAVDGTNNVLEAIASISADSPAKQSTTGHRTMAFFAMPAANFVLASRKQMTEMHDRLTLEAIDLLDTPLWETSTPIEEEILQRRDMPLGRLRYMFVDLLFPSTEGLRHWYQFAEGRREGVMIGIALELYHREHGKWPESLAELSPRWLPKLPVDRITGKPLQYRIIDDRPIVYSIGVDGIDDGGKLPVACEGDTDKYRVSMPAEWGNPDATQSSKDAFYGDWPLWSMVPESKSPN